MYFLNRALFFHSKVNDVKRLWKIKHEILGLMIDHFQTVFKATGNWDTQNIGTKVTKIECEGKPPLANISAAIKIFPEKRMNTYQTAIIFQTLHGKPHEAHQRKARSQEVAEGLSRGQHRTLPYLIEPPCSHLRSRAMETDRTWQ